MISELKPHWSLIESSRQGSGRLNNEPWVYCLSSGVLSPRPCGLLEYYPTVTVRCLGPIRGVYGGQNLVQSGVYGRGHFQTLTEGQRVRIKW